MEQQGVVPAEIAEKLEKSVSTRVEESDKQSGSHCYLHSSTQVACNDPSSVKCEQQTDNCLSDLSMVAAGIETKRSTAQPTGARRFTVDPSKLPGLDFDYGDSPEVSAGDTKKASEQLKDLGNKLKPSLSKNTQEKTSLLKQEQRVDPNREVEYLVQGDSYPTPVDSEQYDDSISPQSFVNIVTTEQHACCDNKTEQVLSNKEAFQDDRLVITDLISQIQSQSKHVVAEKANKDQNVHGQLQNLVSLLKSAQNQAQLNQVMKEQNDLTTKKLLDTVNMQLMLASATKQIEEQKKKLEQVQLLQQIQHLGGTLEQGEVFPSEQPYASTETEESKAPTVLQALNQLLTQQGMKLNKDLKITKSEERNLAEKITNDAVEVSNLKIGINTKLDCKPPTETMTLKTKMQNFFNSQKSKVDKVNSPYPCDKKHNQFPDSNLVASQRKPGNNSLQQANRVKNSNIATDRILTQFEFSQHKRVKGDFSLHMSQTRGEPSGVSVPSHEHSKGKVQVNSKQFRLDREPTSSYQNTLDREQTSSYQYRPDREQTSSHQNSLDWEQTSLQQNRFDREETSLTQNRPNREGFNQYKAHLKHFKPQ